MSTGGSAHRSNVLRAYRELLVLLRGLPSARREGALAEARAGVRANAAERDPGAASDQLKALWARISFLRTVRLEDLAGWHFHSCTAVRVVGPRQ